jgi:TolB-like protein/Flp pilus assembly protein TadD
VSQAPDQPDLPSPDDAPPPGPPRKKATLAELLAELKRRRVFRVMAGYGLFSFAVLQVIEPVLHAYDLPAWLLKTGVTLLAAGFPVALVLSWVFDLTSDGVVRTPRASGGPRLSRGRVAALLLGVGLLAALPGLGWYAWRRGKEAAPAPGTASIAVLPFADLSPNHDQDYFSDGVAEEILNALSRVEGLKVPGRASCFWFKGRNAEASEIASKLGVAHLLEGSVRRSGKKLRVTAEVTRVAGGERLWSQTFEREEADVFAIQDEIAREVVSALKVKLLSGQATASARRPPVPEAYDEYLLGRQLLGQFSFDAHRRAVAPLERATQLDPEFAQAWAALAIALKYQAEQTAERATALDGKRRALEAAERAVGLAPEAAEGYVARSLQADVRGWAWADGLADARRAVELNPRSADAHRAVGMTLATLGRVGEGLLELQRATELEPLSSWMWNGYGWLALCDGKYELARRALARALEINPANQSSPGNLLMIKLLEGRAAEVLAEVGRITVDEGERLQFIAMASHTLGRAQESQAALVRLEREFGGPWPQQVANVHAWRGEPAQAIAWLTRARDRIGGSVDEARYDPFLKGLREDSAFTDFLASINLAPGGRGAAVPAAVAPSIAVLPFADMSEKHDQEYFADGMAEEILNALAHVEGLRVPGRTSSFWFKGKNARLAEIGRELDVATVLEGSVRRAGKRLRVTAQLVKVADGGHLWSETFERPEGDLFAVQDEVARAVAQALKVKLLGASSGGRPAAVNPEAYDQYLLGRQLYTAHYGSPGGWKRIVEDFEKAIALDPGLAPAWASLGIPLFYLADEAATDREAEALRRRAVAAADQALTLQPDLVGGLSTRGYLRGLVRFQWREGLADLRRATALAPSDVDAQRRLGRLLMHARRKAEALPPSRRAVELDPLSVSSWINLGHVHLARGEYPRAREASARALKLNPSSQPPMVTTAEAWLLEGRSREALETFLKLTDEADRVRGVAMAQHALGHRAESEAALARLVAISPRGFVELAEAYAWRGQPERALEVLGRGRLGEPGVTPEGFSSSAFLRALEKEPRYLAMVAGLGLPVD